MALKLILAVAIAPYIAWAVDFTTPLGARGRAEDLGGGVWRVRLADGTGKFRDCGPVQQRAAFLGETPPLLGAPDGSRVEVGESPFSLRFYSRTGRLVREIRSLSEGEGGFSAEGVLSEQEGCYGFGERLDRFNQRGRRVVLYSTDGWNKSGTTYAPMPFFVTTSGSGVFANDDMFMTADMGASDPRKWRLVGEGRLDLYVWATDRMAKAICGLHRLCGGSFPPPDWSSGPIVCRYWPDLTALTGAIAAPVGRSGKKLLGASVQEMLARYDAIGARPKAFVLEAWDVARAFDSGVNGLARLRECGDFLAKNRVKMLVYMRVGAPVAMRHSGFRRDFLVHADIVKSGKTVTADTDAIPDVYLGGDNPNPDSGKMRGVHMALDITNQEMWKWYVNDIWKTLVDCGVSGVKVDFCEELPDDGRDYGGMRVRYRWRNPGVFDGAGVHHAYPAMFASRFLKEMNRLAADRGGFMLLVRGCGIGSGRNPYMWAGDQFRTWDKLDDQLLAVLNSGMSGIPFMTYDMAGYQYDGWTLEPAGRVGSDEVFVRRGKRLSAAEEERMFQRGLAFTAFMPCVQSHGFVRNAYDFGQETRDAYAEMQRMRERLAPEISAAVKTAAEQGLPVVRPLVLSWQDDLETYSLADEFMLGDTLLVAPILGAGDEREVYIPEGIWKEIPGGREFAVGRAGMRVRVRQKGAFPPPVFRLLRRSAVASS